MIPAMIGAFYHEHPWTNWVCAILFGLASYTDYLDGYFARRWQVSTAFGAFLDPVADKLLVSACLICMSGRHGPIVAIPTAIILMREIAVSALREFMAERQIRAVVKVAFIGKLKTALSMVSIAMILLVPENMATLTSETKHLWEYLYNAGFGLFFVSTVLTVISGAQYFAAASPYLSRENTNKNSKV
jgi:CDP-diacylglycerol--glycerol-3-phosphate 3-phosphatidyltransferase